MVGVRPSARTLELLLDCGQKEHTEEQTFLYTHRKHLTHCGMSLVNFYYGIHFLCI